jgi:beta-glucosidase
MCHFSLKPHMRIGTASAPSQIEGNSTDDGGTVSHSWLDWAAKRHIHDGSNPARATDHWRLWREDAELMRDMGFSIYRLGIEWARIEPAPGVFNETALEHYRREIQLLKSFGIEVLVTLHHFTNPLWFEKAGGFTKAENIGHFLRFVEKAVRYFGADVNEYLTINEPNVYAIFGYFYGTWPPGVRSLWKFFRVMSIMAAAHIQAYRLIHRLRQTMGFANTKVSFAHHVKVFIPRKPGSPLQRICTRLNEWIFQDCVSWAFYRGKFFWPLKRYGNLKTDGAKNECYADFIGVNYYSRSTIAGIGEVPPLNVPVNDLGWEIYPGGIVSCLEKLCTVCPAPVYITENGTCDGFEQNAPAAGLTEKFRSRYIYDHLKALCESGLAVERYYHWCFCDNFEWLEGEAARFGIVHVNYESQKRTVKPSGEFLAEIQRRGGVDDDLFDRYVKNQRYQGTSKT